MAPDDHSGAKPAGPVVLRIKLRYDDLEAMVQRFAPNVGKSGLFLPTKSIQPLGTEVKFELRLANDTPVLVGLGRVKHSCAPDPANPRRAFGMAIELMRVTREGREVIIRMLERRRILGLADVAIPFPEDVEAARRSDLETQPRADTSGIVREAMAAMASPPVAEQILIARSTTGPLATVKEPVLECGPIIAAPPEPLAFGRESGPIARPSSFAAPRESRPLNRPIVALAPEAPRARRPRLHELIARAESGPVAAAPVELEEQGDVDVERALARARALATGDLDAELDLLRDNAAAPTELSVEAASAELARQLGGKAIARRDRSARWAPPPAVQIADPAAANQLPADQSPESAGATAESAGSAVAVSEEVTPAAPDAADAPAESPHDAGAPNADLVAPVSARPLASVVAEHEDEDEQDDEDDIEELHSFDVVDDDDDDMPGESTQTGGIPVDPIAFQYAGQPTVPDELAASLEAQLDEAEREADDDLGLHDATADESANGEERAYGEAPGFGEQPAYDDQPPHGQPLADDGLPQGGDDEFEEEVSDFDVLAEADEGDADLLAAHGEQDASGAMQAAPSAAEGLFDFAGRLDLGDEESNHRQLAPEIPAYGEPPSDEFDAPSSTFTFAERSHFDDSDPYGDESPEQVTPIGSEPEPAMLREPPADYDLENALEALDVDLDELSPAVRDRRAPLPGLPAPRPPTGQVPLVRTSAAHAATAPRSTTQADTALARRRPSDPVPKPRRAATEDDGVLIDFDDDD